MYAEVTLQDKRGAEVPSGPFAKQAHQCVLKHHRPDSKDDSFVDGGQRLLVEQEIMRQ